MSDSLRAVCEREDGTFLVAVTGGVNIIQDDKVIGAYGSEDGIENTESLSVEEGFHDDIILGSNGDGIYVIDEDGVKIIGLDEGLPSDTVMRLKKDKDRDLLWIVASNAIAYMTPDYQVTTVQKFPYTNNFDLYETSSGDMWVLSSNGIYVVPTEELIANGEIDPVFYGVANGLPCITTANSYSDITSDGGMFCISEDILLRKNVVDFCPFLCIGRRNEFFGLRQTPPAKAPVVRCE